MDIELDGAVQTTSTEVDAANAANDSDTSEVDDPFQTEEEIQAEMDRLQAENNAAETKALKEMLIQNGFKFRNLFRTENVKQHFTSPFSKENTMSAEDILLEIPKEDLHEVGTVQGRIFMPASLFRSG
jgi:hypothetical protein